MRLVATDRVAWSVGLFVATVSPARVTEPIMILTQVGWRNHVLNGGPVTHTWRAILRAKKGWPRACPDCLAVDIL